MININNNNKNNVNNVEKRKDKTGLITLEIYFPVNFVKFLRTLILQNICEGLLLFTLT